MSVISNSRCWWVPSRRALLYWGVIATVLLGVVLNGVTGVGADISKAVHENQLMDKVGHLVFFGALSFLIHRGLRLHLTCSTGLVVLFSCLIALTLGVLDEFSQLWIEGRNFDYADLWANFVGAVFFGPFGCLLVDRGPESNDPLEEGFDFDLRSPVAGAKNRPSVFLRNPTVAKHHRPRVSSGHRRRGARLN